jgi:8-oxo-dGTP pyrophosphatase MutT (NUDIX family)
MRANVARTRAVTARKTTGTQFAALPYRSTADGIEILLITSRRSKRWIVPKGWPIEGLEPCESAAQEALEEAGLSGEVHREAIGFYTYLKELRHGIDVPCQVRVFPLRVTRQHKTWAEKDVRELRWVPLLEAARMVDGPGLRRLILRFGTQAAVKAPELKTS